MLRRRGGARLREEDLLADLEAAAADDKEPVEQVLCTQRMCVRLAAMFDARAWVAATRHRAYMRMSMCCSYDCKRSC